MPRRLLLALVAVLLSSSASAQSGSAVVINGQRMDAGTLSALEARYQTQVEAGNYWYDAASGAWGHVGRPTSGFIPAGLRIGGALRADASSGRTSVWVNGRRLPSQDLRALVALTGTIEPGRYWLDANGNAGREGGPAQVNLAQLARQAQGSGLRRSWLTGIGSNSSGGSGYVMGRDWSVTYGN
ncbi:MAG: hypothetical protein Rubg2KO_11480 [Rubricoccaceae bacterium]